MVYTSHDIPSPRKGLVFTPRVQHGDIMMPFVLHPTRINERTHIINIAYHIWHIISFIYIYIWWFLKMRVPPSYHPAICLGFSMINHVTIQLLGYPHDYGNHDAPPRAGRSPGHKRALRAGSHELLGKTKAFDQLFRLDLEFVKGFI